MVDDISEYGTSARSAFVTWLLVDAGDHGMSNSELAKRTGMTESGVRRLTSRIVPVVPLYFDYNDNRWRILDDRYGRT